MTLKEMAAWIGSALERGGLSQAELGRQLSAALRRDVDRSIVNKMVLGKRKIPVDELLAISNITGEPLPVESQVVHVPLIDWVSAGKLADPKSQIPVEDVPLLAFADLGRGDFFALKVDGDSMDRVSPEGATIVVNRADKTLVSKKFYVFSVRGETTYKMWHADPPYLAPYSHSAHDPIFPKRQRDLEVIGRVRRSVLDI